ncbi:BTB/POZ and MATH domain-containing protein 3 isoform X2 [Gossypium australe]|uniref:BTB/POZ and MATH domain-containing protein 3 isoform X2 n=1 Tax=Gossypium australe TaxID=47621 RepID=A0A5B6WVY8_9ROSI|nr:BTB/POZ and MATH domain-containing protein 3 isoform X2 [Gossypium australe]
MEKRRERSHLALFKIADATFLPFDGSIRRFHQSKTEWGVSRLLSLDISDNVSMGYLVDDSCIFGAEIFVIKHSGKMECLSMVKKQLNMWQSIVEI